MLYFICTFYELKCIYSSFTAHLDKRRTEKKIRYFFPKGNYISFDYFKKLYQYLKYITCFLEKYVT